MMKNKNKAKQNNQKGQVNMNTEGMATPPTAQAHAHKSTPPNLSANSAAFVPTSSLLTQARDVLYPQNSQTNVTPNIIQQFLPDPNVVIDNCPNNRYSQNADMHGLSFQVSEHQCQQQHRPFINTSTTSTTVNTAQQSSVNTGASQQNTAMTDAPQWVSQILQNLDTRLQQIEKQLVNQNSNWQNINMTLQNQSTRMSHLENKMSELNNIKANVSKCETSLSAMDFDIRHAKQKIENYDESIKTYSALCDDIRSDQNCTDSAVNSLFRRVEHLENEQKLIKTSVSDVASSVTDLQCRSMKDNLIFTGIEESEISEGEFEDTEKVLCNFLENEMCIEKEIPFHRVHRIGKFSHEYDTPRPIVAKFERYKDREEIRLAAPRTLKGKPFGVREQFPKIVEDKRKTLYPIAKEARSDKQNKVRLVRDRLFINNTEVVPDSSAETQAGQYRDRTRFHKQSEQTRASQPAATYSDAVRNKGGYRNIGYGKSRYVYPRQSQQNKNLSQRQSSTVSKSLRFDIPTSNRFKNLTNEGSSERVLKQTDSKKHKASSPLDRDKTLKKYRENDDSDQDSVSSETSYIEVDKSPQCNPPLAQGKIISQSPLKTVEIQNKSKSTVSDHFCHSATHLPQNTAPVSETVNADPLNLDTTTQREQSSKQSCDPVEIQA